MLQYDVIFLCETWLTVDKYSAPREFRTFFVPATQSARGRPAGGLLLLVRQSIPTRLVSLNEDTICIQIGRSPVIALVCAYWCPSDPIDQQLARFCGTLANCKENCLLAIGDFNCRIGPGEDNIADVLPPASVLAHTRRTRDGLLNSRGVALRRALVQEGLIVVNGRTLSDRHGDYTFVASQGCSLVDLIICSIASASIILDAGLLSLVDNHSDHFPLFVNVSRSEPGHQPPPAPVPLNPEPTLRWNENLKFHFNRSLQSGFSNADPSSLVRFSETLWRTAEELGMSRTPRPHRPQNNIQPWFDKTCAYFRKCHSVSLRRMKSGGFIAADRLNFLFLKKMYRLVICHTKDRYFANLSDQIIRANDSSSFWTAVFKLLPSSPKNCAALGIEEITEHFRGIFNSATPLLTENHALSSPSVPFLDQDISLFELDLALKKCKRGKAPGTDGVSYEFFMNLNVNNRCWLLSCLNGILRSEIVPRSWADLKMFLLHKKDDPSIVANYRGISLLNCQAKLFTSIIARRISIWAEENCLIPESQAGFRAGRSCSDNLFVLQTAIHEHIRIPGNHLYCTFVDFKAAFDTVHHEVLWQKLSEYGLSGKLLRILSGFYSQARVQVHYEGSTTPAINIGNGVLQGDCLSPLLFSLLVADFDSYLDNEEVDGVGIGPFWELKCLFYADDLVLLARNLSQMQKALAALNKFCATNHLIVNSTKSKVVVFSAVKVSPSPSLTLNGKPLEVVGEYPYLGVIFSSNGTFSGQEKDAKKKALLAAASTRQILEHMSSLSRKSEYCLFQAKICSTLLYGAEFWSLWSMDLLEQIQLQYYKKLFFLHTSTPGHVIRHYFGLCPQICRVLVKCLKWYNHVLCMSTDRWPRRCLDRLTSRSGDSKYNWVSQIQYLLSLSGVQPPINHESGLFDSASSMSLLASWYSLADMERCKASQHCPLFGNLTAHGVLPVLPSLNLRESRLALQVVLHNTLFQSLFWRGVAVTLAPRNPCPSCASGHLDTIEHMITACSAYSRHRRAVGLPGGVPLAVLLKDPTAVPKALKFIKAAWPLCLTRVAA